MPEQEDTGPDRGALDLRGLLFLFIGFAGALVFYANDVDGTRAGIWLVLFGGGGTALIARAFKQEKVAGAIVALAGIVAGVLLYTDDADNLARAIILALAALGAGAYLMMPRSPA